MVNSTLIAPPVGLNVYVVGALARDVPIGCVYRNVFVFLASDLVRPALLLAVPGRWRCGSRPSFDEVISR